MRGKTYPTPDVQYQRTAGLAESWIAKYEARLRNFPSFEDQLVHWFSLRKHFVRPAFEQTEYRRASCLTRSLEYAKDGHPWGVDSFWKLGVATSNTRHFVEGDVVLAMMASKRERHPIWCFTSKGHTLCNYYVATTRPEGPSVIRLVGCPAELVGKQPTDPDVQRFALSLRAG